MNQTQKLLLGGGILLALAGTAIGASYLTRETIQEKPPVIQHQATHRAQPQPQRVATAQPQPPCDDRNIVGTVGGALAGGLVGNQFGKGTGRNAATVVGAAGGAYLGHEYIPAQGATCR